VLRGVEFGELEPDPAYRAELAEFAEKNGNEALHAKLLAIDPEAASAIHPNNVKRVIRALEICKT
jgi:tRNA dimethylallyltransferase